MNLLLFSLLLTVNADSGGSSHAIQSFIQSFTHMDASMVDDIVVGKPCRTVFKHSNMSTQLLEYSGNGQNDMGNYLNCKALEGATYCKIDLLVSVFQFGVCVPTDVCVQELNNISQTQPGFSANCTDNTVSWSPGAVIFILLSLGLLALVFVGSMKDREVEGDADSYVDMNAPEPEERNEFLYAFSIKRTVKELLERAPSRKYKALDGIRSFSMLWIILGHTLNFMLFIKFTNALDLWPFPQYFLSGFSWITIILSGNFAVDTFFWLSGFLSALVMYRNLEKGKRLKIPLVVLGRYLRIVPVYAYIMMFFSLAAMLMGSGPFWDLMHGDIAHCTKYWWTNLLFINNLVPGVYTSQCMPWTWYLANDMQFFILSIPLIQLVFKRPKLGYTLIVAIIVVSMMLGGIIVGKDNLPSFTMNPQKPEGQNKMYDKPWIRIPPYLIGMLAGFVIARTPDKVQLRNNCKRFVAFAFAFVLMFIAMCFVWFDTKTIQPDCWINYITWQAEGKDGSQFTELDGQWSTFWAVFDAIFGRFMWTMGMQTVTILCITGQGFFIDKILSFPFWDPIAKLSYSAYLLHPLIMRIVYYNQRTSVTFDVMTYMMFYAAFLVLAYIMAAVAYCMVESPFGYLNKLLTQGKPKPTNQL